MNILVVGAGFAGSVIARELADSGNFRLKVIDKRDHIAGNAYDPIHPETGFRYHQYGPHIFHTNDEGIVNYLSRFTEWLPYRHRVKALYPNGAALPMPINRDTLNSYYGQELQSEAEVRIFLDQLRVDSDNPQNAEQHLFSLYGEELTSLCFSRYTRKMWDLELSDLPVSVVARIPVRFGDDPHYFDDQFQMMPKEGYESLIANMLDHPNITIELGVAFDKTSESEFDHVFNSMPIDDYFENCFGPLPYRSIEFEHRFNEAFEFDVPTVNFTDEGPYTRKTDWSLYPGCTGRRGRHVTYERPCSYTENNYERYYPIKTVDGWPQERYAQYKKLAQSKEDMTFIGRCGQYIYYDMHQVVANSLKIASNFLSA